MPKIFEYLGIIFYFYSNEHEPVHVHASKSGCESKASFLIIHGEIEEIVISNVRGKRPLSGKDLGHFKEFVKIYANEIVTKWVNYFVYQKEVEFEKISKKLR